MNFDTLKEKMRDHALELQNAEDPTAKFRATSYGRVVEVLESKYTASDKVSKEKIDALPITDYMKGKLLEISNGKELKKPKVKPAKPKSDRSRSKTVRKIASSAKAKPKVKPKRTKSRSRSHSRSRSRSTSPKSSKSTDTLLKELVKFMGIGEERAKALIEAGLKHVNQLRMKKYMDTLPEETKLFLKLKPTSPIPRTDVVALEPYINKLQSDNLKLQLVGSYRREKPTMNDIDLMAVSTNPDAVEEVLGLLKEVLNGKVYPYSQGRDKLSLLVDMNELLDKTDAIYKIDVFRVEPAQEIPMLLYATGSKEHNILMRGTAKKKGMLLNQKGLFKKNDKGEMILVPGLTTEKDYFDALGLTYKEPKERI